MDDGDRRSAQRWGALVVLASGIGPGCSAVADDGGLAHVDVRVDRLADGVDVAGTYSPLVTSFIADDSGVYWLDARHAVHALRSGDAEVVELKPPLERPEGESRLEFVIGMADDEERLFVGQAFLQTGATDYFPVPEFEPPGRLLVVPKRGGPAVVVAELADATISPIASDATRLIVFVEGRDVSGYYQLLRSSLELERLPLRAPFYSSVRSGDTLYWSDAQYPPTLLSSGFDDAGPKRLGTLENNVVDAGPGYVLSRAERIIEPSFDVAQNFVLHEAASGSERPLPGLDETISLDTALDARHAYWFSYRGESPTRLPPENPLLRLVRVDVSSGALTLLNPEPALGPGARILGQNTEHLYVKSGGAILAIEKP